MKLKHYWQHQRKCYMSFLNRWQRTVCFFRQQLKLMGSSAQISSGVCRCGSQEQVPGECSGRFRRVPVCAGVGSRRIPVYAGVGSGGRFWRVPEISSACWCIGSGRRVRKVPECSGVVYCVAPFKWRPYGQTWHCCWGCHQSLFLISHSGTLEY